MNRRWSKTSFSDSPTGIDMSLAPFHVFQDCPYTPEAVSRALVAAQRLRTWVVNMIYRHGEPWPLEATSFVNVIDDVENHRAGR